MLDRLLQVAWYLRPDLDEAEEQWALEWLTPNQLALWTQMGEADRAHAVRVARRLAARGAPGWVLEAALLHDCGKPAAYGLSARVLGVLLARWLDKIPREPKLHGVRRWLQIYRWHDHDGYVQARLAGTSDDALALLRLYANVQEVGAPTSEEAPAWLESLRACDAEG
jgi:HD superfamily phosphodiesterase